MHSVSNLRWEHHALCGSVQGTLYQPYEVQAVFNDNASWDEGECSCPVGFNCKHVAALLLVNLTHPAKQGNGLRPEPGA